MFKCIGETQFCMGHQASNQASRCLSTVRNPKVITLLAASTIGITVFGILSILATMPNAGSGLNAISHIGKPIGSTLSIAGMLTLGFLYGLCLTGPKKTPKVDSSSAIKEINEADLRSSNRSREFFSDAHRSVGPPVAVPPVFSYPPSPPPSPQSKTDA